LRKLAYSFLAELLGRGAVFAALALMARSLGPDGFGQFVVMQTMAVFAWIAIDSGLSVYGTREIVADRGGSVALVAEMTALRFVLAVVLAVALILTLLVLHVSQAGAVAGSVLLLSLLPRALHLDWVLRGREAFAQLAVIGGSSAFALVAATLVVVRAPGDLMLAGIPWLLAAMVPVPFYARDLVPAFRAIDRLRTAAMARRWRGSFEFLITNFLTDLVVNLPLIVLAAGAGSVAAGEFGAAQRIALAAVFVLSIAPMTLYPRLTYLYAADPEAFDRATAIVTRHITVVSVACALGLVAFASPIIRHTVGSEYGASVPVLRILAVFVALRAIRAVYVRALWAAHRQATVRRLTAAGCMLVLVTQAGLLATGIQAPLTGALALALAEAFLLPAFMLLLTRTRSNGRRQVAACNRGERSDG
jgi:PST family polysaccharide transporter